MGIQIKIVGTQMPSDIKPGDVLIEGTEENVLAGQGHFLTATKVYYDAYDIRSEIEYYEDSYYHSTKTYYCHFKVAGQTLRDYVEVYRIVGCSDENLHTALDEFDIIGLCDYSDVRPGDTLLVGDINEKNFQKIERVNKQVLGCIQYEWTIPNTFERGSYYTPCIHCLFKLVGEKDGKYIVLKLYDNGKIHE